MATPGSGIMPSQQGEEGIKVAIRMRPLNTREHSNSAGGARIWRTLQKFNSIAQTTAEGKPLPERVENRNFFTFDKVFGEKSSTSDVYNNAAKTIVQSVMSGLNGTIFAYGQTSSGKTYTMQGAGNLADGAAAADSGGILHLAAQDIFSLISSSPDRVFLVRVSFIEIYNEEVRDLLVTDPEQGNVLAVREDPRRGVFVTANESIVTDLNSLIGTLFAGEKNRHMASTGMNERSSRSHTIFRITVESREKSDENADDENENDVDEFEMDIDEVNDAAKRSLKGGEGDGAVLVSTLNLVDLAGSESVRHTGATGDRQKEGGKINQSLLTLSRVIVALGQSSNTHINFRDSKLTRILQPSLSGNARMAIICCATPSELYLEETRSTLLFASRAKLVKTNARVNEVLDDRSLIKRLQKELAEARRAAGGRGALQQIKSLENEAAEAEREARQAEEKSRRLKELILKGGMEAGSIAMYNACGGTLTPGKKKESEIAIGEKERRRRRRSDGILYGRGEAVLGRCQTPAPFEGRCDTAKRDREAATFCSPSSSKQKNSILPRTTIKTDKGRITRSPPEFTLAAELDLLRNALVAKGQKTRMLQSRLQDTERTVETTKSKLSGAQIELSKLVSEKEAALAKASSLEADQEFALVEKEAAINDALMKIEKMIKERRELEETNTSLRADVEALEEVRTSIETTLQETRVQATTKEHELKAETENFKQEIKAIKVAFEEEKSVLVEQAAAKDAEIESMKATFEEEKTASEQEKSVLVEQAAAKDAEIESMKASFEEEKTASEQEKSVLVEQAAAKDAEIESMKASFEEQKTASEQEKSVLVEQAAAKDAEIESMKASFEEEKARLNDKVDNVSSEWQLCKDQVKEHASSVLALSDENSDLKKKCLEDEASMAALEADKCRLEEDIKSVENEMEKMAEESRTLLASLSEENEKLRTRINVVEDEKTALRGTIDTLSKSNSDQLNSLVQEKTELEEQLVRLVNTNSDSEKRIAKVIKENQGLEEQRSILESRLQDVSAKVVDSNSAREKISIELSACQDVLSEKISIVQKVEEKLASTEAQIEGFVSDIRDLKKSNANLTEDKTTLEGEINDLRKEVHFTNETRTQQKDLISDLQSQNKKLQDENKEALSSLTKVQSERADLDSIIARLKADLKATVDSKERAKAQADDSTKLLTALKEDRDGLLSTMEELEIEAEASKHTISDLSERIGFLSPLEMQLSESKAQLVALREQLADVDSRAIEAEEVNGRLVEEIKTLSYRLEGEENSANDRQALATTLEQKEIEVMELSRLLADANVAVEEARAAAFAADEELNDKERALEETQNILSVVKAKSLALEKRLETAINTGDADELMKEMEILLEEKQGVEARLEEAIEEKKEIKEQLERRMGEEQRLLINEAEISMKALRKELSDAKADFKSSESALARVRLELEEVSSRQSNVDKESVQNLESQLALSREEAEKLSQEFDQFKAMVYATKEQLEAQANEKLNTLQCDLAAAIDECRKAERETEEYKAQTQQISNQKELLASKLREEIAKMKISLANKEAEIHAVKKDTKREQEQIVASLQQRLAAAEAARDEVMPNRSSGTAGREVDIEDARVEIKKLQKEIKKKDQRIAKLDGAKLTKDQVVALKKMKEERLQYLRERDEAREEIRSLKSIPCTDKENAGLSTRSSSTRSLQADKEAVENKLRKYAKHCQSLEESQQEITDILKSIGISGIDQDIAGAVITLADKLKATEEEIDSLSIERKRTTNRLIEMDRLIDDNEALKKRLSMMRSESTRIEELEGKIAELEKERAELADICKASRDNSSALGLEQSKQLRYLESENHQLMLELKELKKEKGPNAAIASNYDQQPNDDTIELKGITSSVSMGRILRDKNQEQEAPSSPKDGDRAKPKRSAFPSSIKKTASKLRRLKTPAKSKSKVGLGGELNEGVSNGEENTQECTQS